MFLVHNICQIAAIVKDHVQWLAIVENERLTNAPEVFLVGFTFPRIYRHSGDGNG
jgi:hypothetical protein